MRAKEIQAKNNFRLFMHKQTDSKSIKLSIWFNSILRWSLGLLLGGIGWLYAEAEGRWVLFFFSLVLIVTGFFRPRKCLADNCEV
jgi:hypothetical protein